MKKTKEVKRVSREIMGKRAAKHQEQTYWGEEPIWNPLMTEAEIVSEMGHALNWYNAMTDPANQKDFLVNYADSHLSFFLGENNIVERLKKVDENLCTTWGAIARMVSRGAFVPEKYVDGLHDKIISLVNNVEVVKDIVPSVVGRPKARDYKVSEGISLVMGLIDDYGVNERGQFPQVSMADAVLESGLTDSQRLKVQEHFDPFLTEMQNLLVTVNTQPLERSPEQKDLLFAYGKYTVGIIKRIINWLSAEPSEEALEAAPKKERKKKTPKKKTAAQILKYMQPLWEFNEGDLRLKSIDPEKILGATTLYVFNTKNRKLGVYYANEGGLQIKRKSIENYDEERSLNKKLRKPNEVLPKLLVAGKVEMRRFMDDIRTTPSAIKPRITSDTILLKAT